MAPTPGFCSDYGFSVGLEIRGFHLFCFACMCMELLHYQVLLILQILLKKRNFSMTIDSHYVKLPDGLKLLMGNDASRLLESGYGGIQRLLSFPSDS